MATPDTRKLVCGACKHENESERVYCHNCGEKLDRSLLPKVEDVKEEASRASEGKRVQKMMNPNRLNWLRQARTFVLIVIFSAVVATVFLICQAPENVPLEKTDRMPDRIVADVWSQMMETRSPVSVSLAEFDVNDFLKKSIKSTEGALGLKFKRAYVAFTPGLVTITAQREVGGQPLFSSVGFKPVLVNGKWAMEVKELHIGRLGIHPAAGKFAGITLGGFAKAFDKEIKQLDRLAGIEAGPRIITFITKPAQ